MNYYKAPNALLLFLRRKTALLLLVFVVFVAIGIIVLTSTTSSSSDPMMMMKTSPAHQICQEAIATCRDFFQCIVGPADVIEMPITRDYPTNRGWLNSVIRTTISKHHQKDSQVAFLYFFLDVDPRFFCDEEKLHAMLLKHQGKLVLLHQNPMVNSDGVLWPFTLVVPDFEPMPDHDSNNHESKQQQQQNEQQLFRQRRIFWRGKQWPGTELIHPTSPFLEMGNIAHTRHLAVLAVNALASSERGSSFAFFFARGRFNISANEYVDLVDRAAWSLWSLKGGCNNNNDKNNASSSPVLVDVRYASCHEPHQWHVPELCGEMVSQREQRDDALVFLDLDGYASSWKGLRWKMCAGGAVVKVQSAHNSVQWFYPELVNGTHLIEVPIEQLAETLEALLRDEALFQRLQRGALDFCRRFFTRRAAEEFTVKVVTGAATRSNNADNRFWAEMQQKRWFIQTSTKEKDSEVESSSTEIISLRHSDVSLLRARQFGDHRCDMRNGRFFKLLRRGVRVAVHFNAAAARKLASSSVHEVQLHVCEHSCKPLRLAWMKDKRFDPRLGMFSFTLSREDSFMACSFLRLAVRHDVDRVDVAPL